MERSNWAIWFVKGWQYNFSYIVFLIKKEQDLLRKNEIQEKKSLMSSFGSTAIPPYLGLFKIFQLVVNLKKNWMFQKALI